MKKKTVQKRRIRRECWDLDYSFYEWLRQHLPVYLKDAGKIVDLSFHKFTYKGKEWTQEELIKYLIQRLEFMRGLDYIDDGYEEIRCEVHDIWKLISHDMWW